MGCLPSRLRLEWDRLQHSWDCNLPDMLYDANEDPEVDGLGMRTESQPIDWCRQTAYTSLLLFTYYAGNFLPFQLPFFASISHQNDTSLIHNVYNPACIPSKFLPTPGGATTFRTWRYRRLSQRSPVFVRSSPEQQYLLRSEKW